MLTFLGHNFGTGVALHNLGLWFESIEKIVSTTSHNTHNLSTSKYHYWGTGTLIKGLIPQCTKYGSKDPTKLGNFYSYVLCANLSHKFRVMVSYNMCNGKPKGLCIQFQKLVRY
jgi:hypothetical protein